LSKTLSKDVFAGTAVYYLKYRVPYPHVMFLDLLKRTAPPQHGVLLDLASGPGRTAIPLSHFFHKVTANDISPEMVAAGKAEAKKYNIKNIKWCTGRAEEIKITSNTIDLITIGEAFHRFEQNLIANLVLRWLKPGGYIALIGCYNIWRGGEAWQVIVKKTIDKWTQQELSVHRKSKKTHGQYKLILQDSGFENATIFPLAFRMNGQSNQ
jgi:ubiquinone/menaquinone biosynthesis C-methylase UbiE